MEEYVALQPAYDPKIEACSDDDCEIEIFYHILGIIECYCTSGLTLFGQINQLGSVLS